MYNSRMQVECSVKSVSLIYCFIASFGSIGHLFCVTIILLKKMIKKPRFLIIACMSMFDILFNYDVLIGYALARLPINEACSVLSEMAIFIAQIVFQMSLILSMMMAFDQFIFISYGIIYQIIVTWQRVRNAVVISVFL